jgi:hypothetical protein
MWMQLRRFSVPAAAVLLAALAANGAAEAQNKAASGAKPAKAAKAGKPAPKPAAKPKKATKADEAEKVEKADDGATPAGSATGDDAPKPTGEGESQVKGAGTGAAQDALGSKKEPVTQQEDPEGVKTYHFGAIEVESRLKSPQLIYFLRRVRAEFEAGALGHRSFLGELSDTRNDAAFR